LLLCVLATLAQMGKKHVLLMLLPLLPLLQVVQQLHDLRSSAEADARQVQQMLKPQPVLELAQVPCCPVASDSPSALCHARAETVREPLEVPVVLRQPLSTSRHERSCCGYQPWCNLKTLQ
jgi:hypothetical protein